MQNDGVRKVFNVLHRAYEVLVMIILTTMIITVFVNVFSRYVLNYSIGWVDESSRFLFIWLVFLGAVLAYEKNEHIGLDFFLDFLPERARKYVVMASYVLVLIVLLVVTQDGFAVAMRARNISPGLGLRMTYVYISIPVGGFLMGLITVKRIILGIRDLLTPSEISAGKKVDV